MFWLGLGVGLVVAFVIGLIFRPTPKVEVVAAPPPDRCGALLNTGARCLYARAHEGPHLTNIQLTFTSYGVPIYQQFQWHAPDDTTHKVVKG